MNGRLLQKQWHQTETCSDVARHGMPTWRVAMHLIRQ
jgi:hypothetical protein